VHSDIENVKVVYVEVFEREGDGSGYSVSVIDPGRWLDAAAACWPGDLRRHLGVMAWSADTVA